MGQLFRKQGTAFQRTWDNLLENKGQLFRKRTCDSLSSREHGTAFQTENTEQPFRKRTWDSLLDREHGTEFQTENMRQPFREHGATFQAENMRQPFRQKHGTAFQTENMGQPFRHRICDSPPFPIFPSLLLPNTSLFLSGIFHCRKFRQGSF